MRFLLVVLVLLAWTEASRLRGHHHHHCFRAEDMKDGEVPVPFRSRAARVKRHSASQLVPYLENGEATQRRQRRHHGLNCPDLKIQDILNKDINERSISPWRYRLDENEDRYPRQLAFAECLCGGCIDGKTGRETTSLNSVPVVQKMVVLYRKPCQHDSETPGFTFEVKDILVPVACACVLPRSSS